MAGDYRDTLNLPKTDFPMKASLPRLEPEIQRFWEEIGLYRAVQNKTTGRRKYVLHDGPPYPSGEPHLGQALNRTLKDFVVKYRSMNGYDSPFVPGWDMHGLPTERKAIDTFGLDRSAVSPLELRARCAETALHFMDIQRQQFKRLGTRADWECPYLTLDPVYEAAELRVFKRLVELGLVYRGLRPVYWCPTCETALAEAEIEYQESPSPSIYVKFTLSSEPPVALRIPAGTPTSLLVWTTTPWTLPANVAVAVHPEYEYVSVLSGGYVLVMARELMEDSLTAIGVSEVQVLGSVRGSELEHLVCRHPWIDRDSVIVLASYVTLDQGTGCVHTAPGHGKEDFETGQNYGLPTIQPLDQRGVFTDQGGQFAGLRFDTADAEILKELRSRGALLAEKQYLHQYPHCWRSKDPVIFRATEQWFVQVNRLLPQALAAVDQVHWIPEWGGERMKSMVVRPDWCISRQRTWGVPIPAFYCTSCNEVLLSPEVIEYVAAIVEQHGTDEWFRRKPADLIPAGKRCDKCGGSGFRKENDILDVWFDSGCSHAAVLKTRPELSWPADLYMEGGPDQFRGWFQESLWTALALEGSAPFRTVVSHGFFLDETGQKLAKSSASGNILSPIEVCERYGADILRLWVSYVDFKSDMPISEGIFDQVIEAYRRIRNTVRFLLGNLYDFDLARHAVTRDEMREVDRYLMHRLQTVVARVTEAYEGFELHRVYHTLHTFCAVDLSAFYLDMLKDTLYAAAPDGPARRSAQTVLYNLSVALCKLLAPILSHTAEEIWRHLPTGPGREQSVQLADWPQVDSIWMDDELGAKWEWLLLVRAEAAKAIEVARNQRVISQPLHAQVTIYAVGQAHERLSELGADLSSFLIVSEAMLNAEGEVPSDAFQSETVEGLAIAVAQAPGRKCARCWLIRPEVGAGNEEMLCARCASVVKGE